MTVVLDYVTDNSELGNRWFEWKGGPVYGEHTQKSSCCTCFNFVLELKYRQYMGQSAKF